MQMKFYESVIKYFATTKMVWENQYSVDFLGSRSKVGVYNK